MCSVHVPTGLLLHRLADALEAAAVSAPQVTDAQVAELAKWAVELARYIGASDQPFDAFHWAKGALTAALGVSE